MVNAFSSSLSEASGISSVATFSTFIGLPVSIPLAAISLAKASVSGVTTALTKKYQKKLTKVMKLVDILTLALAIFERSLSEALRNGKIDDEEFNSLQTFHLSVLNESTGVDRKIGSGNRNQFEKNLMESMNNIEKS